MKVLYVVGTNLSKNTSANISHNAYVQGLLENDCEVDILMSSSSWGENDISLPVWKKATYFAYNSVSLIDKLKIYVKGIFDKKVITKDDHGDKRNARSVLSSPKPNWKKPVRNLVKNIYNFISNNFQLYKLEKTWLKNASRFKNNAEYDLIISNSSPAAGHKLVLNLLSKRNITGKRWVQIWEDPWFYDVYGGNSEQIKQEEHTLLQAAKEIFYVSVLTLQYQKIHFPDCAHKMEHIPLPFLQLSENKPRKNSESCIFGYFGDYYSNTRDLQPFYEALLNCGASGYIYGDADISLEPTSAVHVQGRVTLDKLGRLQDESDVLVHLCNLHGGQIPGKIYHYSATTKPILFILDGTSEEMLIIKDYFKQYNRYHFCENKTEDIKNIMQLFIAGKENFERQPVLEFQPLQVVSKLLNSTKK